ncbi:MAG: hypothetical protein IT431_09920 [Phycisphaerales bacterium]|nr:hypothetical protein [Phycisphaerales bacterium]
MAKRKSEKKAKDKAEKKSKPKPESAQNGAKSPKKPAKDGKTGGGKKGGKKGAKKAAHQAAKKAAKKADALAPQPVKSGKGATPAEVGAGLVAMVKAGVPEKEIWDKFFSRKFVSIEGGMAQAWHGRAAVQAKAEWWYSAHKVHSLQAEGPYVGATGFGVRYTIDAEEIESGKRHKGDELAFYTVKNGKVVQEEFMGMAAPQEAPQA